MTCKIRKWDLTVKNGRVIDMKMYSLLKEEM